MGCNYKFHFLIGVAAIALSGAARAQDADRPSDVQAESGAGLADIVVTARRRQESQQSVPVAITAISSETLREKIIATPYDLTTSTPGISAIAGSAQRNDVFYFIRGQGANYGSAPSVVTYIADVPQQTNSASGGSNLTFFDLESVQVLKGPQGTLFGRSTTAGAVLLTPKAPSGEFDGFFEATVGNYSMREFNGAINVPIIGDRLAIRIAGNYSYHEGFARSLTTGQDLDDRDRSAYRITLLAQPTDWLKNTTIFSDVNIHENGTATVLGIYEPNGIARRVVDPRLPNGGVVTGSLLDTRAGAGILGVTPGVTEATASGFGYVSVSGLCNNLSGLYGGDTARCISERIALIDRARASLDAEAARLAAGGSVRRLATTRPNLIRSQVQTFINTTELNFGHVGFLGDLSFKNILSTTRNLHSEAIRDTQGGVGTGITFNDLQLTNPNCSPTLCVGQVDAKDIGAGKNDWFDVWSEEAQLSGQINGRHDWLIGFFKETQNNDQFLGFVPWYQAANGAFTVPAGVPGVAGGFTDFKASQTGYFGQVTIDFADFGFDGLNFTAGYRRSNIKQSVTQYPSRFIPATGAEINPNATPVSADLTEKANSYSFTLDYEVGQGLMVYATTRKGFKQGGINILSIVPASQGIAAAQPTFAPERVRDYEVGLKADYALGGVEMRTNLALFNADYSDLQRSSTFFNGQATSNQIVNAAKSRSRGLELEQLIRFTPEFSVNVNYAYLDSKFLTFPGVIVRPGDGAIIDRINTPIPASPKHKLDVAARYSHEFGPDTGNLVVAGNVSYQSKMNLDNDGIFTIAPTIAQDAYAVANLHVDWNNVMGNAVDASFFIKNIFDKTYKIGAGNLVASQLGTVTAIYGDPRTAGVTIRVRFGRSGRD